MLGSPRLAWDDLWALVTNAPIDSAFRRAIDGFDHGWSLRDALQAETVNAARINAWVAGGGKRQYFPKLIEVPFRKPAVAEGGFSRQGDLMTIEEMDRRLAEYS